MFAGIVFAQLILLCVMPEGTAAMQQFLAKLGEDSGFASDVKIMYHHIWKCGGSHLCTVAEADGLRVPKNVGCHRWFHPAAENGSGQRWLNFREDASGQRQTWRTCSIFHNETDVQELSREPFNFFGHECPVNERLVADARRAGFKWMVSLRDPVEQVVSWHRHSVQFDVGVSPSLVDWMHERSGEHGFSFFLDNLQTRWLAGVAKGVDCSFEKCPDLSTTKCSACLSMAKNNLKSMDVVVEQKGRLMIGARKLHAIGWPASVLDSQNESLKTDETSEAVGKMTTIERATVEKAVALDIELIKWARENGLLDARV